MYKDINLQKAFAYVFDKRPIILPNDSLFASLQQRDKELSGAELSSMGRAEYDAYSLCGMLRDLNVNINECKNALKLSNNDVNQAAQLLLRKAN